MRRSTWRCESADGALVAALEAARVESGVSQSVRLLLDKDRTIPVVWGIFRPQLLLPAEAEQWNATQLRSVLLHELAQGCVESLVITFAEACKQACKRTTQTLARAQHTHTLMQANANART